MTETPSGPMAALFQEIVNLTFAVESDRRASNIIDIATITLLIDANIISIEQAVQRIEHIDSVLLAEKKDEGVALRIQLVTEWLRAHDKSPAGAWTPQVIEGGLTERSDDDQSD